MKNYQKIKTALYALLLSFTLLSFKASTAQTYARLERQDPFSSVNYNPGGGFERQETSGYHYYMRFYSDQACTIPKILTSDVHCGVSWTAYYDEALNYGGTFTSETTEGTGQSEIYLGEVLIQDLWYDYDNVAWGLQNALEGGFADGTTYVGWGF